MQHRDHVTLQKILDEVKIAIQMLGDTSLDDFRTTYNFIPWKDISGFRDIAAHKYKTLDMKIVYNTVKLDIAELKEDIENILNDSL